MSKKNKKLSPKKGKSGAKKAGSKKPAKKSSGKKKPAKSPAPKKKSSAKSKPAKKKSASSAKTKKPIAAKKLKKSAVKKSAPKAAKKVKALPKKAKAPIAKKIQAPKKPEAPKPIAKKAAVEVKKAPEVKVQSPAAKPAKVASPAKADQANKPKPIKIIKADSLPVVLDVADEKPGKEPAGKYELEFPVHCSAPILYEFLTTPSGLSEWFCDDVNIKEGIYSFKWNESVQSAKLLKAIPEKLVRYRWTEKNDGSYFEFRIERDELTNDISLIITDFAVGEEVASSKLLWDSQVDKLLHVLGSYF